MKQWTGNMGTINGETVRLTYNLSGRWALWVGMTFISDHPDHAAAVDEANRLIASAHLRDTDLGLVVDGPVHETDEAAMDAAWGGHTPSLDETIAIGCRVDMEPPTTVDEYARDFAELNAPAHDITDIDAWAARIAARIRELPADAEMIDIFEAACEVE